MSYFHGYSDEESARLRSQAKVLAPYIHDALPLTGRENLLEVGSGVGGQSVLLAARFPELQITAVERDQRSHEAALAFFEQQPELKKRIRPICADAAALPVELTDFDAAYICWVLEHVVQPLPFLEGVKRALAPGGLLIAQEVFGQSFKTAPPASPQLSHYYESYMRHQASLGGDPDVGVKLGNLLKQAGFEEIEVQARTVLLDDRHPEERRVIFDYMGELLGSVEEGLVASQLCQPGDGPAIMKELSAMGRTGGALFFYTFIRATARAPA